MSFTTLCANIERSIKFANQSKETADLAGIEIIPFEKWESLPEEKQADFCPDPYDEIIEITLTGDEVEWQEIAAVLKESDSDLATEIGIRIHEAVRNAGS